MTERAPASLLCAIFACVASVALAHCAGGAAVGAGSPSGPASASSPIPGGSGLASPTPVPLTTGTPSANEDASVGIPFPAATDPDAFYAQPSPFPSLAHGTILASRPIAYAPGGATMTNEAYQLKFVSQDIYGRKIAAVETVVKPLAPATGTEPLLVEAFAEDALGASCAPSHYVTGARNDSNEILETGLPTGALAAGYTLAFPDFEGPYSLYAVGRQEGLIVNDAEIAALSFPPLGLSAKTPIGAHGYSGGAHAVSWAAAEQPSYAPQLDLVATASGGTPADILGILEAIDGTSASDVASNTAFFDIIYMSGIGINRGYPNFLTPILNAKGIAAAQAMENGCIGKNSDGSGGPTGHFSDYTTVPDPDTDPHVTTYAATASEPQPGLFPTSNVFVYQSVTDELIPVEGPDKLVRGWCADGTPIEYYRAANGGDHVTMELETVPIVLSYFQDRFGGLPLTSPPQTTDCN